MKIPHWDYLSWARDRFGTAQALLGYPRVVCTRKAKINMGGRPVYLRTGTSDMEVWNSVFQRMEYAIAGGEPKFIVDAGAHIGLSAIYFAQRYPEAKIIAIELDARNFRLLKRNVRRYANIVPIHAGLWSRPTMLSVANPAGNTWAYRASEGSEVRGMTMTEIMAAYGVDHVDLLKIDIEGGEREVFEHAEPWIDRVSVLVVELHDYLGVEGCTEALQHAIRGRPFRHSQSGENVVLSRL